MPEDTDLDTAPADDDDNDDGQQDDSGTDDDKGDRNGPSDSDDGADGDDDGLHEAGKKAIDRMKRERNAARKALNDANKKIKEYADKDKSESQRLSEAADEAKSRASKSEQGYLKLQTAMERAPEGASLKQIKAVAKRLSGEDQDELDADADELFALLAPSTSERAKAPAGRPKERLRGGGDPDEEPEEMDPRKLADLIGRP